MTKGDIKWLNNKLKYEDLAAERNMDVDHWYDMMSDMSDAQFKRFQALLLSNDVKELNNFLDQFGIKHV